MTSDDDEPFIDNGNVLLPHQCDEWFVGGRAAVEQMIADLTELLKDPSLKP
jgi:hypothetical protein